MADLLYISLVVRLLVSEKTDTADTYSLHRAPWPWTELSWEQERRTFRTPRPGTCSWNVPNTGPEPAPAYVHTYIRHNTYIQHTEHITGTL